MKKINFSFLNMAALLVAGAALVACSEKNLNVGEEIPKYTYSVSVNATKGEDAATDAETRALTLDGTGTETTLNATWHTTESVAVQRGSTWADGTLSPISNGARAYLKGTLTVAGSPIEAGNTLFLQFPKSGAISYTGQIGTLENIAENFDYATASVTVSDVNGETGIITTSDADFENQQAIVKFNLLHSDGTQYTSVDVSSLTVNGSIDVTPASASSVLYVAMPGFAAGSSLTLSATDNSSRNYSFSKADFPQAIDNGHFYEFNIKFKPVITASPASLSIASNKASSGHTITYSITNVATNAKVTATPSDETITIDSIQDLANGATVSFSVDKKYNAGTITLSYYGAAPVVINVNHPS